MAAEPNATRPFIHEDFLLDTPAAVRLYHEYAEHEPVCDFHCHLVPSEIAADRTFDNLTQAWLYGDHYKWRMMRADGAREVEATGPVSVGAAGASDPAASDRARFDRYAATMPRLIGHPLYHWTHMELSRTFGVDRLLSPETADAVWEACNAKLGPKGLSASQLMRAADVRTVCTTDDPADSLEFHKAILDAGASKPGSVSVLPTFRPDRYLRVRSADFKAGIAGLSTAVGFPVNTLESLFAALEASAKHFADHGCRISDHAQDPPVYVESTMAEAHRVFNRAFSGLPPTAEEEAVFRSVTMLFLGRLYHRLDWAMQLHIGCSRNNNLRWLPSLGPDTGFDAIADPVGIQATARFLAALDATGQLPRTVLYNLNPADNEALACLTGCFPGEGVRGKIQYGSAWWFNDHRRGIENQLSALAEQSVLGNFIGMTTDSRSFLSYPRHEYFRRILSALLGRWIERGEAPRDFTLVGGLVKDVSYTNAARFFGL